MKSISISEKLKSHFLNLYHMALSDDEFSPLELKMLYNFAQERGIDSHHLDQILHSDSTMTICQPETLNEKIEYLHDLTQMIWADEKVDHNERSALEKYIKLLGFMDENVSALADYFLDAVKNGQTKDQIINELNS